MCIYTYITAHSALPHRRTTGKYTPGQTETPHLILFPNCVYVKPQLRPNWIPWTTFQLGRSCCLTLTQFGNSIAGQMWRLSLPRSVFSGWTPVRKRGVCSILLYVGAHLVYRGLTVVTPCRFRGTWSQCSRNRR